MATFKVFRRDAGTNAPVLVLQDLEGVASGLGNANLKEDIASLATQAYVDGKIDAMAIIRFKGRVEAESNLPTEDNRAGDMYLVGAADAESLEEFVWTDAGAWERLGSVRASDVDLSGYTTTEGMNAAISAAQTVVQGNLDAAKTELEGDIAAAKTELEGDIAALDAKITSGMDALTQELRTVDTVPAEWPTDMAETGVLMHIITA